MPTGPREKLVRLLDYVEQVIRLDEKVIFQLSDYRLPDGASFCITGPEHRDLPGVRVGARDDEGPVWLEVARLAREEPPPPPAEIADWIVPSPDPALPPRSRSRRLVTADAAERDLALANGEVRPEDVMETSHKRDGPDGCSAMLRVDAPSGASARNHRQDRELDSRPVVQMGNRRAASARYDRDLSTAL